MTKVLKFIVFLITAEVAPFRLSKPHMISKTTSHFPKIALRLWLTTRPFLPSVTAIRWYFFLIQRQGLLESRNLPHKSYALGQKKLNPLACLPIPHRVRKAPEILVSAGKAFATLALSNASFITTSHTHFKFLFHLVTRGSWISLSTNAFFQRFQAALELLTNLFYFDSKVLTLGNKLFWNETLALNSFLLQHGSLDFTLLRHKFFFHDQKLSPVSPFLFQKIQTTEVETVFVPDILTHQSNVRHFKRTHYFLLGVVPVNFNPWLVHFPIPVFNQNLAVLHFALRLTYFAWVRTRALRRIWLLRAWKRALV